MAGPGYQKILTKIGNRAGSITGIGTGVGQLISSQRAKKAAMESTPAAIDPNQSAFLVELQQKKNALNTGAEYTSSLDAITDNMAQTQDVLAGNSGGDVGGTVSALLKSQQMGNRGTGELLAQGQQSENFNTGIYGNVLDKIVQRKMELGLLGRAQNMAEWAQKQQTGMANVTAGAQSMMDFKGSDQKAANPAIPGGMGTGATTDVAGGGTGVGTNVPGGTGGVSTSKPGGGNTGIVGKIMGGTKTAGGSGSAGGNMDFSKIKGILSQFGGK